MTKTDDSWDIEGNIGPIRQQRSTSTEVGGQITNVITPSISDATTDQNSQAIAPQINQEPVLALTPQAAQAMQTIVHICDCAAKVERLIAEQTVQILSQFQGLFALLSGENNTQSNDEPPLWLTEFRDDLTTLITIFNTITTMQPTRNQRTMPNWLDIAINRVIPAGFAAMGVAPHEGTSAAGRMGEAAWGKLFPGSSQSNTDNEFNLTQQITGGISQLDNLRDSITASIVATPTRGEVLTGNGDDNGLDDIQQSVDRLEHSVDRGFANMQALLNSHNYMEAGNANNETGLSNEGFDMHLGQITNGAEIFFNN
ncbi:MAG: hypothetical protein FWE37_05820 [Spirochaetaceae bacterium]|nr:hypothetical protein [Spirochaetaceae bacterium]